MRHRRLPILTLILTFALLTTVTALADPAVYYIANLTGVAATSIDAVICDFKRVLVGDALIAVRAGVVAMRIVDDHEAKTNPSCVAPICGGEPVIVRTQ